jgi:hypothetical protein
MDSASSRGIEPSLAEVFRKSIMARARRFFVNSVEACYMVRITHSRDVYLINAGGGGNFKQATNHFEGIETEGLGGERGFEESKRIKSVKILDSGRGKNDPVRIVVFRSSS